MHNHGSRFHEYGKDSRSDIYRPKAEACSHEAGELNRASTEARIPCARLDRLDLQGCICQSKDIRIRRIA